MKPDNKSPNLLVGVGIAIAFAAAMLAILFLTGCDSAGNPDYRTIGAVTRAVSGAMSHEQDQEYEEPQTRYPQYPVLYDTYGNPIYPPR